MYIVSSSCSVIMKNRRRIKCLCIGKISIGHKGNIINNKTKLVRSFMTQLRLCLYFHEVAFAHLFEAAVVDNLQRAETLAEYWWIKWNLEERQDDWEGLEVEQLKAGNSMALKW
mmetsp:Transcript_132/g.317  ORF Transcript_132/g.317 Transcript_132/m.317 type:complete len:114 (-) Transcript_132:2721-3062(-)